MASYSYVAVDIDGKEKKGKMEAPDEDRVFYTLRSEGYFPVTIRELGVFNVNFNIQLGSPIKPRDLSVFCRQFYSILKAGVPIVAALEMLVEQTEHKALRKATKNTLFMVAKGEKLADSMRNQGKIFPPILINMIEAGEISGSLETSLERMSIHFEKEARLKALMKKASVYPAAIGIMALIVVIIMLTYVIPSFMKMFNDMNMEMPALTKAIMALSDYVRTKWYVVIGVTIFIIILFIVFKSSTKGKLILAKISLKLPLFGKLKVKTASARLSRTLSTLLAAGIPLIDAIDITARTMDNLIIKRMLIHAKEEIARGIPLSVPIKASRIFPAIVYQMIKIGEDTGSIEEMLTKIADYYDEEVEVGTQTLTAAMEPMIIIVLAIVVGGLVMAIMQPMFEMYDQLDTSLLGGGDPGAGLE